MNINKKLTGICSVLASGLVSCVCFADTVVYDNEAGEAAGIDSTVQSDFDGNQIGADDVMLATTTVVSGIEWTGVYAFSNSPEVDDFLIAIHADKGGLPMGGEPIAGFAVGDAVNRIDSGIDFVGLDIYEYSADLNFTMEAGVRYWIAIVANTSNDPGDNFQWGTLGVQGNGSFSLNEGATWLAGVARHDFRLTAFLLGDVNQDGKVSLLDVAPFVDRLTTGTFQAEADINGDGNVNLLDVAGFVELLTGG